MELELGLDPDDFDIVFAYPWPGEEQIIFDLFASHAATGAQGHRPMPPGARHREVKHRARPRGRVEQRVAIGDGVLACLGGQLVDEALDHDHVAGEPDAAPTAGQDRRRRLVADELDAAVGEGVGAERAPDDVQVDPVLEVGGKEARRDRRSDGAVHDRDRHAECHRGGW